MTPDAPVVVGVDGSEHSLVAADLAADEAARRRSPLELVYAFVPPVLVRPAGVPPDLPPTAPAADLGEHQLREHAEQILSEAAARLRSAHSDLPMISRLHDGYPAEVLTAASRQARLVVVGHRGLGGFAGLLVGSVGIQLAHHAACPVMIVRGEPASGAPVVAGVDGSEGSRRAAEFAAEAAGYYRAALVLLYAQPHDQGWAPERAQAGYPPPDVPAPVAETIADITQRHPELSVQPQFRHDQPAHEALVAASKNARLVVAGTRGVGGFRGLLLGSVSHALIHHARCPVAVVGPAAA
jgi:nucleotide-binding universal stress UspA family protein